MSAGKAGPRTRAEGELCRLGGVASLLLLGYSLATMVQIVLLGGPPPTAGDAFAALQENRLVGLLRLDLPTALALALYYPLYLGLHAALKRTAPAATVLAVALGVIGVTLVVAAPGALSMLALSDRHAAATSAEARSQLLAAGEAILSADMWHGTGAFVGGLLGQLATVLLSVLMLGNDAFGRRLAWLGIVTHGLDLAHIVALPVAPTLGFALMAVAGPLYLPWFFLVGLRLLRLGRRPPEEVVAGA